MELIKSSLLCRPQIVVARLDGSLEFFNLGVPLRRSMNSPLQESSPIKRSSPRVTRKINPHSNNDPGTIGKEDPTQLCINLPHPFTLPGSPQCRVSHKLRAHHQPISVLGVMEGRVITGSHDRTLKVNGLFFVSVITIDLKTDLYRFKVKAKRDSSIVPWCLFGNVTIY